MTGTANYVRSVALIGGSGNVGSHILKHLLATGVHNVTVLTRPTSTATFAPDAHLTVKKVDYTSEDSVAEALAGAGFLILALSASTPPTVHASIVKAAGRAGVPHVMPNYYGFGIGARAGTLSSDPIIGRFGKFIEDVEAVQGVSYTALVCGFWYEFSLGMGEQWYGFDLPNRRVTLYDQGTTKICTSTWEQCGKAVAALLSLPVTATGDGSPSLEEWKNAGLYIHSFCLSQRDMLDSLHRVLGTSDADWKITFQPAAERQKEGLQELQAGNRLGFAKAMYARLFFENGYGDYSTSGDMDDDKLGLEKEDLDEATRRAVKMVEEEGFGLRNLAAT